MSGPRVTLAPLPRAEVGAVRHLELAPGQADFVISIALMTSETRRSVEFHVIRDAGSGEAVGFFKIDRAYGEDVRFAGPEETGLRGMLIGAQYQRRGYGTAALSALPDYLRLTYPGLRRVRLTVNLRNLVATRAYLTSGWRDTGDVWTAHRSGPQHIFALDL